MQQEQRKFVEEYGRKNINENTEESIDQDNQEGQNIEGSPITENGEEQRPVEEYGRMGLD